MRTIHKVALAATLASFSAVSQAGVRLSVFNALNFSSVGAMLVPLSSAGATIVTFNLPAAGRKVLTFSSACAVSAAAVNSTAWSDIDIIVNGAVVAPTVGAADAFCSANGTAGFDGWETNAITVVIQGVAGANTVRILGRPNGGATGI